MATKYTNLPGVFLDVLDGQLTTVPSPGDPIFLILGTTDVTQETINGTPIDISWPYRVDGTSAATTLFGSSSGLGKGLIEAASGGATNFRLYRVAGNSDGKRAMYEGLFKAFDLMYDQPVDMVVPYGVYLDDANVMDMDSGAATTVAANVSTDTDKDTLGLFYAEKINGVWEFAWWFPKDPAALVFDTADPANSADANGEYSAPRGPNIDRAALTIEKFHEVNFAYQLADFCHRGSSIVDMRLGAIGVNPPKKANGAVDFDDLAAQASWVGRSPASSAGSITVDGDGLLGNKFMAGSTGFNSGLAGGGFFATDDTTGRGYLDGVALTDANGEKVDIGKYLSVMASWATVGTGTGWAASAAATYAGFLSTLGAQSAPTNKSLQGMLTVRGSVAAPSLDLLAGAKYVGLMNKATRSAVITDGPTAAQSSSDYRRVSTMRQVEECVDGIRLVSEPFLGEGMTAAELNALDTAIGAKLSDVKSRGIISGYDYQVLMSPQQKILGEATVQLKLIPAFELRQITIVVGLSAS